MQLSHHDQSTGYDGRVEVRACGDGVENWYDDRSITLRSYSKSMVKREARTGNTGTKFWCSHGAYDSHDTIPLK